MRKIKYVSLILLTLFLGGVFSVNINNKTYTVAEAATKTKAPLILNSGWYGVFGEIAIQADKGCTIYYTINGAEPNKKSTIYKKPIILQAGKKYIIKAVAYKGSQKSQVISFTYHDKLDELGEKVKTIIKDNIKSDMTDFEKIMKIMLYFENNIRYDLYSTNAYNAKGALIYNRATCAGYSDGFWILMRVLDIPCIRVGGVTNWYSTPGGHEWNMVQLEGTWYMLEPQGSSVLQSNQEFKERGYTWNEASYPKCPKNYFSSVKTLTYSKYLSEIAEDLDHTNMRFVNVEKIVIQKGVKTIKDYCFEGYRKLISVEIPDTIEVIGEGSFINCTKLTSMTIPASVKMIGNNAFAETQWLKNQKSEFIILGDGILIGDNLTDYSYVEIPNTVKVISGAFAKNNALMAVNIPNTVTKIVNGAFDNATSLSSMVIPDSVIEIGENVFRSCYNLLDVKLSSNLKKLGVRAFIGCHKLKSIKFPDGLEQIDVLAFDYCYELNEVEIPKSVTTISSSFNNTPWLKNYPSDFVIVGDSVLMHYKGKDSIITIPKGVKTISSAFRDFRSIKKVILPDTLIKIEDYAFSYQENLESIVIPDGVTYIGALALSGTNIKEITIPGTVKSIGRDAFASCKQLKTVTMKNGVVSIGQDAFMDTALEKITIPKSVKNIAAFIFPEKANKKDLKVICSKNSVAYNYALKYGATVIIK